MGKLLGPLLLIALIGAGAFLWWDVGVQPSDVRDDDGRHSVDAQDEEAAASEASSSTIAGAGAAANQREDVATTEVPGTRISGVLRIGEDALGDALLEVWRRPLRGEPSLHTTLRTDSGGGFSIDGILAERHAFAVRDDRAPLGTVVAEFKPSGQGEVDLGECEIRRPGTVAATVVDGSGAPLAGVRVVLDHREWSSGFGPEVRLGLVGGEPGALPESHTDARGEVRFERIAPGWVDLTFDLGEFLGKTRYGEVAEGESLELGTVKLVRGRRIDGRVLDWTGQPVAGARVRLSTRSVSGDAERATVCGEDGCFTLSGMPTESTPTLRIEAERHVTVETSNYTTRGVAEIRLPRAFWVSGVVTGAVSHALTVRTDAVRVNTERRTFLNRFQVSRKKFVVGEDGRYEVGPLLPGAWKAWADGGARGSSTAVEIAVVDQDLELDLEIPHRAELSVIVRTADGQPAAAVPIAWRDGPEIRYPDLYRQPDVWCAKRIVKAGERSGKRRVSDASGRASVPIDTSGPFAIAVSPEGGIVQALGFVEGERPEEVEIVLTATGAIHGRLLGLADAKVKRWRVSAKLADPASRDETGSCAVRADGVFELDTLPVGRYVLQLYTSGPLFDPDATVKRGDGAGLLGGGHQPAGAGVVEVVADEVTRCDIEMPVTARVRGVVRMRNAVVEGCQVFAMSDEEARDREAAGVGFSGLDYDRPPIGAPVAISDESGKYLFRVAHRGGWQIYVRHPKGYVTSGPWPVEVRSSGQDIVLDVRLGGGGIDVSIAKDWFDAWPARGRRQAYLFRASEAGSDAFTMDHAYLHALPQSAHLTPAVFDADGRARFDFVPPGQYVLRLTARLEQLYQQGVVVIGDEDIHIGPLAEPSRFDVALAVEVPKLPKAEPSTEAQEHLRPSLGLVVRALFEGVDAPAFVSRMGVGGSGRLSLRRLRPGRYRVQAVAVRIGDFGDSEDAIGSSAEFEVDAQGVVAPSELDLR